MPLDIRSTLILQELVHAQDFLFANDFMKKLNVSKRTFYYDLEKANSWLKDQQLQPILRSYSKGFYLDPDMKQIVLHHLRKVGHNQYYYTKNERVSLLGVMLILKNGFIAARGLMEKTGVSRVTTFKDLDELKQSLADFKLTIEFNKKNGYVVKGNENNKRKAIAYYLTQLFSQQGRKQLSAQVQSLLGPKLFEFALPTPVNKKKQDDFPLGISDFYEILADCEKSIGIELSDEMLQALSLNLFIICERLEKESTVQIDEYEMTALQSTPEYVTASKLAKVLEEKKGFILPENEISFLTMHLLGSRLNSVNEESQTKEMAALRKVLKDMIFDFQKFACIFFQNQDELEKLLFLHLKPAYYRIKYDVFTENPLTEEIKEKYREVFQITKKVVFHLENLLGKKVNDQETAYIAMYFGGWMKRQGSIPTLRHRAIVVCESGIGTSNLLRFQLEQLLSSVDIVDVISSRDYQKNQYDVDFYFSTVPLTEKGKSIIQVNPILTDADKSELLAKLNGIVGGNVKLKMTITSLLNVIHKHATVINEENLIQDLKSLLQINDFIPKEPKKPMLHELLTEKTIQFKSHVDNWEDAIRVASNPLVKQGNVTEGYVNAMVDNVNQLGPYIVIVPHIAIPHARPESGVKKLGMSMLCLNHPVSFSSKEEHQVRLVIILAAIDNEMHLQALSQLITLLSDENKVAKIMEATSPEEVVLLLHDLPPSQ